MRRRIHPLRTARAPAPMRREILPMRRMPTPRASDRLACVALLLAAAAVGSTAAAGDAPPVSSRSGAASVRHGSVPERVAEPQKWLDRMNDALTKLNYDGVFSHEQNGQIETLRIIHRVEGREVMERLVSL